LIQTPPAERPSVPASRRWFQLADRFNGGLLLIIVSLAPWLFGATEDWAIFALNLLSYLCGFVFVLLWLRRWRRGSFSVEAIVGRVDAAERSSGWTIRAMAVLTALVLLFCLVAALNARATFVPEAQQLLYHDHYLPWLPTTYDQTLTWRAFWSYLGLGCRRSRRNLLRG
jgi:hypothetical protein